MSFYPTLRRVKAVPSYARGRALKLKGTPKFNTYAYGSVTFVVRKKKHKKKK